MFPVPVSPREQEEKRFQKLMLGMSDGSQGRLKRPLEPQPGHFWGDAANWQPLCNQEAAGERATAPAREASAGLLLTALPPAWARMGGWV